jgi:hypothetical protein
MYAVVHMCSFLIISINSFCNGYTAGTVRDKEITWSPSGSDHKHRNGCAMGGTDPKKYLWDSGAFYPKLRGMIYVSLQIDQEQNHVRC